MMMNRGLSRLLLLLTILFMAGGCNTKTEKQAMTSGQEIFFDKSTYDFGEMEEDSDGLYDIPFKNISDSAILINKVRSSCGCTIPSWPKKPIEPGETGIIKVKYNTALTGSFMKSVYIYSTASNSPVKLTVKGKVIPKQNT